MTSIQNTPELPFKDPEESIIVTFDYLNDLSVGETISTPVVTAQTHGGTDASPSAILSGSPQLASPQVTQKIIAGLANVNYRLQCKVNTSAARVLVLAGILPVREA